MNHCGNDYPSTSSELCYFCNESMEPRYLADHVIHCGAVLEECPERCGAYVPRRELREHQIQCFRGLNGKMQRTGASINETIRSLQESSWRNKVVSILSLLKNAVHDGEKEIKELRDTLASSLQLTNEALRKDILEELFENRRMFTVVTTRLNNLEKSLLELQERSMLQFDTLLETTKAEVTAESANVRELWQEQLQNVHDMRLELEMRCKLSKELVNKYNDLFDKIDSLERQLQQHANMIAQQSANWTALKLQMQDNVEYIEDKLKDLQIDKYCECRYSSSAIGRLIWRIDRFAEKMSEAKQNDGVVFSPIFYDKEYGYALRMELHLNGLGKWKNRHVIGCLRIIDGKWDPLLEWPCVLKADVILRDQNNPANDMGKFVKSVKKGKAHDDELDHNSDLYMFIPHLALHRWPGYTAGNVMFLDIRIKDQKFKGSTLSLV